MKRLLQSGALLACAAILLAGCDNNNRDEHAHPITTSLSTNRAHIGDIVHLTMRVEHPVDGKLSFSGPEENPAVHIHNRKAQTKEKTGDFAQTVYNYTLSSMELGSHVLIDGDLIISNGSGTAQTHPIPLTLLEVVSILSNEQMTAKGIKDLEEWPSTIPRALIWVPILLLLAAVIGLLGARLLNKPRTILHTAPELPADRIAMAALRRLKEKGYIEDGQAEAFYIEISSIVRHYLEARYTIKAPELTTEEFIREASENSALQAEHRRLIERFLEQSDLVKFARFKPRTPEMEAAFCSAEQMVAETGTSLQRDKAEPMQTGDAV